MFDFYYFCSSLAQRVMLKKTDKILIVAVALLLLFPVRAVRAQDAQLAGIGYSPYSLFGFGDLVRQGSGYSLSMGGIGIADRNVRYINFINPAAVTAREAKSFMMDFGLENRNTVYQGNAAAAMGSEASGVHKSAHNTFNMHHIVVSLPIESHSAFKAGIMPYSTVGYKFEAHEQSDELLAEVGDIRYVRSGEGGIYQAFLGAGVTLWNRLSVGADVNYYFGQIDRSSNAEFINNSSFRAINSGWTYNVSCFGGKAGLQYTQPLTNALSTVLGLTYTFPARLRGGEIRYAFGETGSATDTVTYERRSLENFNAPSEIGAGITFRYADRWMFGFDYSQQDWSATVTSAYPGVDFEAGIARNFRAGFEITPNRYDIRSGFFHALRRLTYRAGVYHELSYMTLGGSRVASTGVTLGMGIPVFRYYNSINFGIEAGQRGTLDNNLIRERYFLFTLSFNLHDIWFIKSLYY